MLVYERLAISIKSRQHISYQWRGYLCYKKITDYNFPLKVCTFHVANQGHGLCVQRTIYSNVSFF